MTSDTVGCGDHALAHDQATTSVSQDNDRGNGHKGLLHVNGRGEIVISPDRQHEWGLLPGTAFEAHELGDGLYLRRKDLPLSRLYIEPTALCNLDCRTCVRRSWDEPLGSMSMETYERLIEALREVPTLRSMAFWGFGEPLMHPQIVRMIQMAHELGVRTEMISNALLLTESMARSLIQAGLDSLVISVDGVDAAAYSDVRSGGDLNQVRNNVARLAALKEALGRNNPEIGLEFVAMRSNLEQIQHLDTLARQMQASLIVITNVLPYAPEMKDEILYGLTAGRSYPAQRSTITPEVMLPRLDPNRHLVESAMTLKARSGYADPPLPGAHSGGGHCRFINEGAAAIGWDGQLSPCIALLHSYTCYVMRREKNMRRHTLGSVAETPITEIWQQPEYAAFRDRVRRFDFAPCTDCGGCNMSESNEEDCFGNPFPVCGDCLWAKGVIQCP